jgi:histidine kinase-like protein
MDADSQPYQPDPRHRDWRRRDYLEYAAIPSAAAAARYRTRQILTEWGLSALAEDAQVVISELVANALRAFEGDRRFPGDDPQRWEMARPPVRIWTVTDSRFVAFIVWDGFQGLPVPPPALPADDSENGRGLLMVDALTDRWGYYPASGEQWFPPLDGKVTWAAFDLATAEPAEALAARVS